MLAQCVVGKWLGVAGSPQRRGGEGYAPKEQYTWVPALTPFLLAFVSCQSSLPAWALATASLAGLAPELGP